MANANAKKSYLFPESQLQLNPGGDASNPGFIIKGHKLRWLSHTVQSFKPGRQWKTLRLSDLDPKFVEKWKPSYNHLMDNGEGTIRRREMVLSYASIEECEKVRREQKELQQLQEGSIRSRNRNSKAGLVADVEETSVRHAPSGI